MLDNLQTQGSPLKRNTLKRENILRVVVCTGVALYKRLLNNESLYVENGEPRAEIAVFKIPLPNFQVVDSAQ